MRQLILFLFMSICFFANAQYSLAQRTKHFNHDNGTAIQGYDPVAYFTQGRAVEGQENISSVYQGVKYLFSSTSNKKSFDMNPSQYEPQYGGWCAYAMGDSGNKVEIDPETFKIIEGKLYLFYNAYFNNTLNSWNKNEKNLKSNADKNWSNIIKQ